LLILAVLAFAPAALAGSPALREAAKAKGYSAADVAAIEAPIDQAQAAGIPAELLVKKAFEGVSKRVPAPVIARVLNEQKGRAQAVRGALPADRRNDSRVLQAALTASAAGADLAAVEAVGAAARERAEAALYVLGVLCSGGVAGAPASAFVRAQVEAGLPPAEMESLSVAGVRAVKAGLATGDDLGKVTPASLRNGGSQVLAGRLNGVRASMPGAVAPEPVRPPVAERRLERQVERNAETSNVRAAEQPKPALTGGGDKPGAGDGAGKPDEHQDDHQSDDKEDAPKTGRR
jgi:hypothetical protein